METVFARYPLFLESEFYLVSVPTFTTGAVGAAVAAVCEAVAVDTVFFKTPSPPQCNLKDDPICDLSLGNHDEQWYKILYEGQQAYLRTFNAAED